MLCPIHRIEKDKIDKKGRAYHWHQDGVMCWGDKMFDLNKKESIDLSNASPTQEPALTKVELDIQEDEQIYGSKKEQYREFQKGLGVFSSNARGEGMSPAQAFDTMNLGEWLTAAYGDFPYFEDWLNGVKERSK